MEKLSRFFSSYIVAPKIRTENVFSVRINQNQTYFSHNEDFQIFGLQKIESFSMFYCCMRNIFLVNISRVLGIKWDFSMCENVLDVFRYLSLDSKLINLISARDEHRRYLMIKMVWILTVHVLLRCLFQGLT